MSINDWKQTQLEPLVWEFVLRQGEGLKIVRIYLTTTTPRVMVYSTIVDHFGRIESVPASLFMDELLELVERAKGN